MDKSERTGESNTLASCRREKRGLRLGGMNYEKNLGCIARARVHSAECLWTKAEGSRIGRGRRGGPLGHANRDLAKNAGDAFPAGKGLLKDY